MFSEGCWLVWLCHGPVRGALVAANSHNKTASAIKTLQGMRGEHIYIIPVSHCGPDALLLCYLLKTARKETLELGIEVKSSE